jgi:hypothetical protein
MEDRVVVTVTKIDVPFGDVLGLVMQVMIATVLGGALLSIAGAVIAVVCGVSLATLGGG